MIGQYSLPIEELQADAERPALFQNVASWRIVCGFAVLTLIGIAACVCGPVDWHPSPNSSRHARTGAFNPCLPTKNGIGPARAGLRRVPLQGNKLQKQEQPLTLPRMRATDIALSENKVRWQSDKFYTHSGHGYSRRLCDDVVSWFVQEHLGPYRVNLEIVHGGLKRQGAWGLCQVSDDGNCYRPRDFRITVQSGLSQGDYVSTLLHELWHVKQMMVGELRLLVREQYWQDTPIENTISDGHEPQAEKMESALAKEFWLSRQS